MTSRTRTMAITRLAYPIVIAQLGSILQGWADTIMVGQYGTPELSAAGFVNNVFNFCLYFLLGISYATTPIVATFFIQRKYVQVLRSLRESNWVGLMASMVIAALLIVLYLNLHRLGQPSHLLPIMRPYFLCLILSLPFLSLFNSLKQFFDALGDTKTPMWVMIASNIMNFVLNYLFIFILDQGLFGAGLATLISRIFMPAALYEALKYGKLLRSSQFLSAMKAPEQLACSRAGMLTLFRLGLPISIQMCLEAGSFNVCAIFMGWIGATALAAHQVMGTVATLGFMVYYGIGAAAAIRIAHYRGLNDWQEVRMTARTAFLLSLVSSVIVTLFICLSATQIARLFTTSMEVATLFFALLPCFVAYQFGDCLQTIYANSLRAIESVRAMMLYAFLAYGVISVPLAYLFAFPLHLGAVGIWWSFPFGLTAAGIGYYIHFRHRLSHCSSPSKEQGT